MLAFYVDFLLTNSRKNIYGTVKIKLLSARGEMSLVLFSQRDDADTFERMACLASVVMKIVDCYIGSILSIGCFLLEWLIRVTCPIAHRCRLPIPLVKSISFDSCRSVDRTRCSGLVSRSLVSLFYCLRSSELVQLVISLMSRV
jgi:hypothetical protein